MNFPEFLGSAFFLAFQFNLIGNPEFPGIFRHFLGEGFGGPQIAFSGEDGVDMLGSGDTFSFLGNKFPNRTGHLLHAAFGQGFFCVIRALSCGPFCGHGNYTMIQIF